MTDMKLLREVMSLRLEALTYYKEAGVAYARVKSLLDDASEDNPIETDLGTFTSFHSYIQKTGHFQDDAHSYIEIASYWKVLVKYGLHKSFYDKSLYDVVSDCCRFIDIYRDLILAGADPDDLSLADIKAEDRRRQDEDIELDDDEPLELKTLDDLISSCDDAAFAVLGQLIDKTKALGFH